MQLNCIKLAANFSDNHAIYWLKHPYTHLAQLGLPSSTYKYITIIKDDHGCVNK